MKNTLLIYSKRANSLHILEELFKLHQIPYELITKESILKQKLPLAQALIIDSFIRPEVTGVDFAREYMKNLTHVSVFIFRNHHLSDKDEEFISEHKINLLSKPIFPLAFFKRIAQGLK